MTKLPILVEAAFLKECADRKVNADAKLAEIVTRWLRAMAAHKRLKGAK